MPPPPSGVLALLPLASGTGALLLLTGEANTRYFGPIGLYGLAITFGLFMYQLRGIQTCIALRDHAAGLEEVLDVPAGHGQFRDRPRVALGGFVGAEGASWTVYLAKKRLPSATPAGGAAAVTWWLGLAAIFSAGGGWRFVLIYAPREPFPPRMQWCREGASRDE